MAVRRGGRTFTRGPKRPVGWASALSTTWAAVNNGTTVMAALIPAAGWETFLQATIVRIRGVLQARGSLGATGIEIAGAYGIIVVKEAARLIGVTAIPHPATDGNADWMYWTPLMGFSHTVATEKTIDSLPVNLIIDCKAMRKVDPQVDCLIEVFQNIGPDIFEVMTGHHILLKE